jgi:ornithine decarboxylase
MYYINEGVYGSFNCLIFDHSTVEAIPLRDYHGNDEKFASSIWGPSCDSMDCVAKNVMLPECNIGDWLYFKEMGAYTLSAASGFNGFLPPSCFYFISLGAKDELKKYLPIVSIVSVKIMINVEERSPVSMAINTNSALNYIDIRC